MPVDLFSIVENIHGNDDGYLIGTMKLQVGSETMWFHCHFVRVTTDENGAQDCDGKSDCARQWWESFCLLDDVAYGVLEIPGHDGEWVMVTTPYEK